MRYDPAMLTGTRSLAEHVCYVVNSILQSNRRGGLPWWRAVGHGGRLDPEFAKVQAKKLAADGVIVIDGKLRR